MESTTSTRKRSKKKKEEAKHSSQHHHNRRQRRKKQQQCQNRNHYQQQTQPCRNNDKKRKRKEGDKKGDVMVDIMAQLALQRAKAKAAAAATSASAQDEDGNKDKKSHDCKITSRSSPNLKGNNKFDNGSNSSEQQQHQRTKKKKTTTKKKININYTTATSVPRKSHSKPTTATQVNNKSTTQQHSNENSKTILSATTTESSPPPVLGNYKYDPIQKAYFPINHHHPSVKKNQQNSNHNHHPTQKQPNNPISFIGLLYNPPYVISNFISSTNKAMNCLLLNHVTTEYKSNSKHRAVMKQKVQDCVFMRGLTIVPTTTTFIPNVVNRKEEEQEEKEKRYCCRQTDGNDELLQPLGRNTADSTMAILSAKKKKKCKKKSKEIQYNDIYCSMFYPMLNIANHNVNRDILLRQGGRNRRRPATTATALNNNKVPLDCHCKTILHPTAPTFDIKQPSSSHPMLPHMVTIVDGGLYYCPPYQPYERKPQFMFCRDEYNNIHWWKNNYEDGRGVVQSRNDSSASSRAASRASAQIAGSLLPITTGFRNSQNTIYRGIRFAPFQRSIDDNNILVGAMACDNSMENHVFTLAEVGSNGNNSSYVTDGGDMPNFLSYSARLESSMNDFAFSIDSGWGAPGKVAFAPNLSPRSASILKPSLLDLERMNIQHTSSSSWQHCPSDVLCVEYHDNSRCDTILYGHRNGNISLLDCRSGSFSSITKPVQTSRKSNQIDDFGSVASLQSLSSDKCIIAKGSFGTLHVFDTRRLETAKHRASSSSTPSLLWKLSPPSKVTNQTQSTRCTGFALDPSRCVVISPFALRCKQGQPALGSWSLSSGKFLGHSALFQNELTSIEKEEACLSYCELSKVQTNAWGFSPYGCRNDVNYAERTSNSNITIEERRGEWGLFFKCGNLLHPKDVPVEASGIHHVRFPGLLDSMNNKAGR